MYSDDELIALSALQHVSVCPRQCYLIHREQLWSENFFTAAGRIMHEKADSFESGYIAPGIRQVRSLLLRSFEYGLVGRADLVEIDENRAVVYPVEYKFGKPGRSGANNIQLCAQALCLEEMRRTSIPAGAVYYGRERRRIRVEFTPELRCATLNAVRLVRTILASDTAPPPIAEKKVCDGCSLRDLCLPEIARLPDPDSYFEKILREQDDIP